MVRLYTNLPNKIYILCICMVINGLGSFVFPLITFILKLKIGFTEDQIGLIITLFIICQAPCLLIGGKLIDHYGRKPLIIFSYMLAGSCYLACSLIEPSFFMGLLIIVASILFSVTGPVFNTLIADFTNEENRNASFSIMYLANNIGFSVSPLLGGLLFSKYLSILFIVNAASMIISIIIFCLFIKEPYSFKESETGKPRNLAESRSYQEKTVGILVNNPILILAALVMFVYQFSYSQWGFLLPLQMVDRFNAAGTQFYGIIAGINGFAVIFLTPLLTYKLRRISAINLIIFGGVCYAAAFITFGIANTLSVFVIAIAIMTLGEVMIVMNYNVFIANNTPETHRGRILSLLPIITGSGYALGPVVVGNFIDLGYTKIWILLGISVFGAAIAMRSLAVRKIQRKYPL